MLLIPATETRLMSNARPNDDVPTSVSYFNLTVPQKESFDVFFQINNLLWKFYSEHFPR